MGVFSLSPIRAALLALGLAALPGLSLAQTCPDVELGGAALEFDSAVLAGGQTVDVVAGGDVDVGLCLDIPGSGFVALSPDFELSLSGVGAGADLQLAVTASCDATVLVNDYSGAWHFADDADGSTDPRLVITGAQDGVYDIWVGTFDTATCDATLTLTTFAPGTAPPLDVAIEGAGLCPDPSIESAVDTLDMTTLGTPRVQEIVAGGDLDLGACPNVPGGGYIIQGPDLEFSLVGNADGLDLEIRVEAACDAVLLLNDANGEWQYVDDAEGTLNPVLVLTAAPEGVYDLWVGSIGAESCDATLSFAALGGVTAPTPGKGGGAAVEEEAPVEEEAAPGGKGGGAAPTEDGGDDAIESPDAIPDPGNLTAFRADVGVLLSIEVTGSTDGFVWGTDVYTDDSDVSTAAVHAGVVAPGETAVVIVEMLGPQDSFAASELNGVATSAFGAWGGSFAFFLGDE